MTLQTRGQKLAFFPDDPISRIQWIHVDELQANHWNPNVCYGPEFKLLERSVLLTGWVQPILVNINGIIIDGFHRYTLSKTSKALLEKYQGLVPCAVLDVDDGTAKLMTVRMNRAKGSHIAIRMSGLIKSLVDDHGYAFEQIAPEIGAITAEVELLYQDNVFKAKGLDKVPYSLAWVPAESKDKTVEHPAQGTQQTLSDVYRDPLNPNPDPIVVESTEPIAEAVEET